MRNRVVRYHKKRTFRLLKIVKGFRVVKRLKVFNEYHGGFQELVQRRRMKVRAYYLRKLRKHIRTKLKTKKP